MMSYTRTLPPTRVIATVLAMLALAACATSHRSEAPGTTAPAAKASEPASESYATPPPAAESMDEAPKMQQQRHDSMPDPDTRTRASGAQAPRETSSKAAEQARPAAPVAAPTPGLVPRSAKRKSDGEGANLLAGPEDLGADPLLPTAKDSTDLRVAIQDWRNAADQLAQSHGCDDGCRAFQSMQRAATRICNLVLNQDPAQRCAAAKSRLESAQRDITQRCGKCER